MAAELAAGAVKRGLPLHGIAGHRELRAALPPRLRVLLCQSFGLMAPPGVFNKMRSGCFPEGGVGRPSGHG